jgi:CheY-like chemotaxis protein
VSDTTGSGAGFDPPSAHTRRWTVLYVEDDVVNVLLIERILEMRPELELMVGPDARRGIALALEHEPDLILLDMRLPDMKGDEVLRRLRAEPQTEKTPVIVVTADDNPRLIERLFALGATDFLPKPIDLSRFLSVIDRYSASG